MIIARFDNFTLIMVHVPKAAGSALCLTLRRYRQFGQQWNEYLKIDQGVDQTHTALYYDYIQSYLKCRTSTTTIPYPLNETQIMISVRNPYDRLHSAFLFNRRTKHYTMRGIHHHTRFDWFQKSFTQLVKGPLRDWVRQYERATKECRALEPVGIHFSPMTCFVTDREGQIQFDHCLRQENLDGDFEQFCSQVGWSTAGNQSLRSGTGLESTMSVARSSGVQGLRPAPTYGYLKHYDREMIRVVNEIYETDFQNFGYAQLDPERFPISI